MTFELKDRVRTTDTIKLTSQRVLTYVTRQTATNGVEGVDDEAFVSALALAKGQEGTITAIRTSDDGGGYYEVTFDNGFVLDAVFLSNNDRHRTNVVEKI
ncbi:hypothetical protein ACGF13_26235 [Kitasatospora sp. NPDC048286]|uniref:hypothetical protein n=1 Tax=Kitasatospora sp. NPDC048286 TaxID=3364047 RepID=UPI003718174F